VRGCLADESAVVAAHKRHLGIFPGTKLAVAVARGQNRCRKGQSSYELHHYDRRVRNHVLCDSSKGDARAVKDGHDSPR
jgi:hypothetical protein